MVKEKTRKPLLLLSAACMSIVTGCANMDMESINAKFSNVTERITSGVSGTSNTSNPSNRQTDNANTTDEGIAAAQAEADKICASHIVFTADITSGIVVKRDGLNNINSDRGFFSATKVIEANGMKWLNTYALPSKDAKYAVLVASKTTWDRKDINTLDLIEKCKKKDESAVVRHFYDSGDIIKSDNAKGTTDLIVNANKGRFDDGVYKDPDTFPDSARPIKTGPRVYGTNKLSVNVLQESKVTERVIGFVLGGNGYQIIINGNSRKTEVATVDSECPITGIYEMRVGRNSIAGEVTYEIEDTAQIAAYRALYKEFVEKQKSEDKARLAAEQEKALHF